MLEPQNRNQNQFPIEQCVTRRVYRIHSRNLDIGVYDGKEGFIGIREKFGNRYLFTEYHRDQGPPFGTVTPQADTGIDLPEDIPLLERLPGAVDSATGRPVEFGGPRDQGGRGWYFVDSGESSRDIHPTSIPNTKLFEFLDEIDKGDGHLFRGSS